jgi:hypothetical protein
MPRRQMVQATELRRMFNEGRYRERLEEGELAAISAGNRHPAPSFEPYCTVSQTVHYYTRTLPRPAKVAIVHQYLRPDGTLGASGKPDPKAIIQGDTMYILDPGSQ